MALLGEKSEHYFSEQYQTAVLFVIWVHVQLSRER